MNDDQLLRLRNEVRSRTGTGAIPPDLRACRHTCESVDNCYLEGCSVLRAAIEE